MSDDRLVEEIKSIVLQSIGTMRCDVFLFGSRADGTARPTSDVGLQADAPIAPSILQGIRDALEQSNIPLKVDIVDLSTVSQSRPQPVWK